jgi:thiamine biosynthesis protein ThiS
MVPREMTIVLNGDERECREDLTIADLVTELGLGQRRIAVEANREIIPREQYAIHRLRAGDHLEIVHFVGGG